MQEAERAFSTARHGRSIGSSPYEFELSLVELYEEQELLPSLLERMRSNRFAVVWPGRVP